MGFSNSAWVPVTMSGVLSPKKKKENESKVSGHDTGVYTEEW